MNSDSRTVGELLVARKVLSRDLLEELLEREQITGAPFVRQIVAEGLVSPHDLTAALAQHLGMPAWIASEQPIPPMLRAMIPAETSRKLRAVVVGSQGDRLTVAMEDPACIGSADQIAQLTGWKVQPALAVAADIRAIQDEMYGAPPGGDAQEADAESLHLNTLLHQMVEIGASDLHLSAGRLPSARIDGDIAEMTEYPVLTGSEIRRLVYGILSDRQRERFEADLELDTSHSIPALGRFRVNVFQQRDSVGAVFRAIPHVIVPLDKLGVPASLSELTTIPRGLVLVTGPTGSGKSTTLASLIDIINSTRPVHIMTVEDPIEFLHNHKRAVVNQREVGEDTQSFAQALRHVLRQDPDVILVGEMRDLETISTALSAAETGHLVFGTLHTQDAPQSVDRIIDVFPSHQQAQIRVQLASALQAVVTQQLLKRNNEPGRVVATEILIATSAVRNLIREGKIHQVYSVMQAGAKYGMRTMDHSLAELVRSAAITMEVAVEHCHHEDDVRRLVSAGR